MNINKEDFNNEKINRNLIQTIGISSYKKQIYLQEKTRYLNSIFVGKSGTGKTTKILPYLAIQDIQNKDCGATIVIDDEDVAFQLFAFAKILKRKVYFINPYMDVPYLYDFLNLEEYNYSFINDKVINYKKAIREKSIIIINMNSHKYSDFSFKIVSMMLSHFQIDMVDTIETKRKPHFLYIDNYENYLEDIYNIVSISKSYNIGVTLFANSLYDSKEYFNKLESNIRNTFILNSICEMDYQYFKKKFYDINIEKFYYHKYMEFLYEIVDNDRNRKVGEGIIEPVFEADLLEEINTKSLKFKKKAYNKIENLKKKSKRMEKLKEKKKDTDKDKPKLIKSEPFIENGFGINDNEEHINTPIKEEKYDNQTLFFHEEDCNNSENKIAKSIINQINIIEKLPKEIKKENINKKEIERKREYISLSDINLDDIF